MRMAYDWESNRIDFDDKYGNRFTLQLRGNINIITGDSGSGKTLLCNKLRNITNDRNVSTKRYDVGNLFVVDRADISRIKEQRGKLILIDDAEMVLRDDLIEHINHDSNNRYMLFTRKPLGVAVTPNHFAEMVRDERGFRLEYAFDVGGWC